MTVPTAAPKQGYHGDEGYRRNTPDLRLKRSVFEDKGRYIFLVCVSENHWPSGE